MNDAEFKNLPHQIGDLRIASNGNEISDGYKPDLTVCDDRGMLTYIIESENKTDRKAFLGDFIKAEKHSEYCNATPSLIIVMQQSYNTTVKQIGNHIRPYVEWLSKIKGGNLNLSKIVIISDVEYLKSIQSKELLCSQAFLDRAFIIAP